MASRRRAVARVRANRTREGLEALLVHARPLAWYRPGRTVRVADRMQTRYTYALAARPGRDFAEGFAPALTPAAMLRAGVFEGKYLNDCVLELPREWYARAMARLSPAAPAPGLNAFGVRSRQSLAHWRAKGWAPAAPGDPDVRGWFQWYCRYWLGRRVPALDAVQIRRWRAFARHAGQVRAAVRALRPAARPRTRAEKRRHRPRQRQALLQWAHDPWL